MQCAICAGPASHAIAVSLSQRLARLGDLEMQASVRGIGEQAEAAEIVLVVVDAATVGACLASVDGLRRRGTAGVRLAVGEAPVHAELAAFLAAGAVELLFLPSSDDELLARLCKALAQAPVALAGHARAALPDRRLRHVIGSGGAFGKLLALLPTVAGCDVGVLVLGETGTGKEVLAQAVHYLSPRAAGPWVAVNCAAIPVELLESELFGHARGAYTTAHAMRPGLVAEAEGGTLFLDDVDCLPLAAQSKLLRLLQEREYRPVGADAPRRADIRIIAASNRDLATEVARGAFRQDLYYRLNVLALELPPLRERREDIAPLAQHFIERYAKQFRRDVSGLSPLGLRELMRHDWPGNVRELEHVIERAVVLARQPVLDAADVSPCGRGRGAAPPTADSFQAEKARIVGEFERLYIERVLSNCAGNVTRAAREAGKNRRAFFALMTKHRIDAGRFRPAAGAASGLAG